jgi:hypothetical protein
MTLPIVQQSRNLNLMPTTNELLQISEICKTLATCDFYKKLGAGGVLAIYLTSKELGLPFMTCLNGGLYTFDGKVSLSSQLMNMMIVNAGHRADVIRLDETACLIRFWRCDRQKGNGDTFDYSFTLDMAHKAGYMGKDNWKKSPRDMLFSRALSGGARKFMPDVLMNCYVFGEIPDFDEHCVNVVPPIVNKAEEKKIEPIKELPLIKLEGYDSFVAKFQSEFGNQVFDYVDLIAKKSDISKVQVWNCALQNEKVFQERFLKWATEPSQNKVEVKND